MAPDSPVLMVRSLTGRGGAGWTEVRRRGFREDDAVIREPLLHGIRILPEWGKVPSFRHVEDGMREQSALLSTGVGLAVMLGLLWQAAFSVAMLADYWRNGRSFYMPQIAGAWPYVHQHLAWIAVLVAAAFGRWAMARAFAVAAMALTVVSLASLLDSGGGAVFVLTAVGVASVGILPAVVVLQRGRRIRVAGMATVWLVAFALIGAALAVATADPPSRFGTAYLFSGPAAQGALYVLLWAWITVVAVVAIHGRHEARASRFAAALSAGHLLVVAGWWLAAEATAPYGNLGWTTSAAAVRVLVVGAIAAALTAWARRDVPAGWDRRLRRAAKPVA